MRYKALIISLLFISLTFATPKKKLKECQEENRQLLDSIEILLSHTDSEVTIEMPCDYSKKEVKQIQKTKRKVAKYEHKTEKVRENQVTNRNLFVNIRRLVSQNAWIFLVFGLFCLITGIPIGRISKR